MIRKPKGKTTLWADVVITGGDYATGGLLLVDANGDSVEDFIRGTIDVAFYDSLGNGYIYAPTTKKLKVYTGDATEYGVAAIDTTVKMIAMGV
jgi:hypothetical protein